MLTKLLSPRLQGIDFKHLSSTSLWISSFRQEVYQKGNTHAAGK